MSNIKKKVSEYNFSLFSAAVDTLSSTASSVFNDTVATFALQNIEVTYL